MSLFTPSIFKLNIDFEGFGKTFILNFFCWLSGSIEGVWFVIESLATVVLFVLKSSEEGIGCFAMVALW